ncbi:universal stress protein [Isoptericola sediminis]|uniref:Universal stress protein n=1 Tax=Isoptericola sediminis TaxID=2733572 RepID=A0A849K5C5_9MICO|nr:universal stress protein [Isoptericola sediminis]NNU28568.1 universal stress protein [Isoptericola sediminis]
MAIVVGHLSTPEGEKALAAAEAEALQRQTRLVVISPGSGGEDVTQRLEAASVEHVVVPGTGDLAEDLVREALEAQAELIVIGLRRRSPVGKLILGSGAQRILLEAPCPVLAVKP